MLKLKSRIIQRIGPLGAYAMGRWLTRSTPKILMYHRFSAAPKAGFVHKSVFEQQVAYLRRNFTVLPLAQVIDALSQGKPTPDNSLVITVDDGYSDFYDIAYPVLKQHDVPATLFVTTRFLDGGVWLWPDLIKYILAQLDTVECVETPATRGWRSDHITEEQRAWLFNAIVEHLLSIADEAKNEWIREFATSHGVAVPSSPTSEYQAITWDQAHELCANNIEIGAHTRTHPSLGRVSEKQLAFEIEGCAQDIKNRLGFCPSSFCYPNGRPLDYSDLVKAHVEKAGFRGAVTAFYDRNLNSELYELRRFSASDEWFQFAKAANGIEMLSARWFNSTNQGQVLA